MKPMSGILGEVYAARFLRDRGYSLRAANFGCRFGELDIVASPSEQDDLLAVVEVKARLEGSMLRPIEAVTAQKVERIKLATRVYLQAAGLKDVQLRFDVIEVWLNEQFEVTRVEHLPNAYT
ncbi:YraN family protein [Neobittarella massiliensis]|uniref:UPF0102 protein H8K20_05310 n=2 Tax=Neobittarella massiliensis (ex Bilen et al. 2018) TaxID=2041842 RepID=A0A8J6ING3_9FIRM|nr:YraN family protein [Neobittarella massiliensis]